jgi:hypothetical protein
MANDPTPARSADGALRANLRCRESPIVAVFCRWVWPRLPSRIQQWIGIPVHPVHVRANAAYALGILGEAARPAVPDLERLLRNDEDYMVRSVACEALQRINPEAAGRFYPKLFEQQLTPRSKPTRTTNAADVFSPKLSL